MKRLERLGSSFLQAVRQIQSLYRRGNRVDKDAILTLEKTMAVVQHHDGVSGTSKQHVAYDYAKKIQTGIDKVIASLEKESIFGQHGNIEFCQLRNESICETSQTSSSTGSPFYLYLYNGLGQPRSEVISIPISQNASYVIERIFHSGTAGNSDDWVQVNSTVVPNFNYAKIKDAAPYNLMIDVQDIPSTPMVAILKVSSESQALHTPVKSILEESRNLRSKDPTRKDSNSFVLHQGKTQIHIEELVHFY